MGRGQRTKQNLTAKSRLAKITNLHPETVNWIKGSNQLIANFKSISYKESNLGVRQPERPVKNFPILFKDNGDPWDIGNLYLLKYYYEVGKLSEPSFSTILNKAKSLLLYLRWIETMQHNGYQIHELHFPDDPDERVTYRYKRYLQSLLRQVPQLISLSTARERMTQVIQFYRCILKWGIIDEDRIGHEPYHEYHIDIGYMNSEGIRAIKSALTTDLSFKYRRDRPSDCMAIQDGQRLVPLSEYEQDVILDELRKYGNRTFELFVHVSLMTGARLQSVGTLRILDLKRIYNQKPNQHGEVRLKIGSGFLTDIKGERRYYSQGVLFFPVELVKALIDYIQSPLAISRRQKSFYGDNDNNYIFLNSQGRPFYTSYQETIDRYQRYTLNPSDARVNNDYPIANGQAITNLMNRLKSCIDSKHANFRRFRFHDLRATYGMNFIRQWISSGQSLNVGIGELQVRLSHSSVFTTYKYLNYGAEVEKITELEDLHYDILNKGSLL